MFRANKTSIQGQHLKDIVRALNPKTHLVVIDRQFFTTDSPADKEEEDVDLLFAIIKWSYFLQVKMGTKG